MKQWVKLRTGEGQHYDTKVGLHIRGTEIKPLPENIPAGSLTAQRLAIGGLVICGPPEEEVELIEIEPEPDPVGVGLVPTLPDEPEPEPESDPEPVPDAAAEPEPESKESFIDRTAKQIIEKFSMKELKEACNRHGIAVPKRPKAETLAKRIAEAEWEQQQG